MMMQRVVLWLIVLPSFTLFGCAPGQGGMGGGWNHMMGYGYGGGFMWIIVLVLVGIILYYLVQGSRTGGGSDAMQRETPLDILKKRYARGEIDKEAFDRMKKDLES